MKLVILIFLLSISSLTYSHEYFFAFAEVEYNDISKKLEATLTATTHDLEKAIREKHEGLKNIETINIGSDDYVILESYLLNHFSLSGPEKSELNLIGFEVLMNGVTNFFFESSEIELNDKLIIGFDLLMKQHEEQQNKITFYYRNETYTRPFLYDTRVHEIKLLKK